MSVTPNATATDELAHFIAGTRLADIPAEVIDRGRLVLADCIGCMAAGAVVPEVRRLAALQTAKGTGVASVIGTGQILPADAAAFINGTAGTWHDLDEGNLSTRTHAGIQLVPAALAEAESRALSGAKLLEALILAYEGSARIWRATKARHAVHPHGTYGPLAAAMALSKLRGDQPAAIAIAANIAATLGVAASRKSLDDGATVRNVYSGHSGRAGYEALSLRDAGFTGETNAVASIMGNIYGSAFDAGLVTAELGRTWWILRNYFKRFATGRYAHGALDLIEDFSERLGPRLEATAIERIDVDTFFWAASLAAQAVRTPFGLRFSLPMAIARRIVHGRVALTDDGERAFRDPAVAALAKRVFVVEDTAASSAY
ncbi:MAG: MmgE/PrpD family protein, partial [Hyphomicrobiaceae bacterium]|nr:MmgE/PrpD family protein [Hyphomicrobiaceae bacterium]